MIRYDNLTFNSDMTQIFNSQTHKLFFTFFILLIGLIFMSSCNKSQPQDDIISDKKKLSEYIHSIRNKEDSLTILLNKCEQSNNHYCSMLTLNQLGKLHRNNASFSEALNFHQRALELSLSYRDTVNMVETLNSIGTVFRRIGALSEASHYHFQALEYAEAYSKLDTYDGAKNRIKSLNGIGNISLTLGHYEDALSYLQRALEGEIELESALGQAINLANIGSIYEHMEQYDSARIYYEESLRQNKIANSTLGIGLSHIHLGDLYRIEENYEQAKDEYEKAFILMDNISDKWHWLQACLSLANIHFLTDNAVEFQNYVKAAEQTATEINSPEHLSKVYDLKHNFQLKKNDHKLALQNYKRSIALNDSVQGVKKGNQYMDIRVNYERRKYDRFIRELELENTEKQRRRQVSFYLLALISILALLIAAFMYYAYRQRTRVNKTLKKLEDIRSSFYTGITHEFRTPLTIMMGMAEQIKDKRLDNAEAISIIQQGNVLLNLVNQLLDMTKVKSNTENLKWVHDDVVSYIQMLVETLKEYTLSKKIDLVFESDMRRMKADFLPDFIDKIVLNLFSNAVKHTPEGGKITINIEKLSDQYIIQVTDTGTGIKEKDLPYIFDEFYQSEDQWQTGTGIGLALVYKMIQIMKGEIAVANRPEGGAEFTIILPLKQKFVVEETTANPNIKLKERYFFLDESKSKDRLIEEVVDDARPLILVVEDNADIQNYISSLLDDNYQVRFASDGQEGYDKAYDFRPELIITDLTMPVMDGFELCNAIRSNQHLNHIPIIVITAKSSEEDKELALSLGANAFMVKPFSAKELKIRVEKLLQQKETMIKKFSKMTVEKLGTEQSSTDNDRAFVEHITAIIYQHLSDPSLDSEMLAERVFMSKSQINRRIKNTTDLSLAAFISRIRLENAKRLLRSNNKPVSDIAYECGFEDSNYFSRMFKQTYNQTPSQYRRSWQEKGK